MTAIPARLRLSLMLVATLVLAGALAIVLLARPGSDSASSGFLGAESPPGLRPLDFALRDQDGRLVRLSDYRGRPLMLTFMYSTCQDTCPVTAQQMRIAMDDLPGPVPALAISVDPAHDTPLNARRFVNKQSLTGRLRFLVGSRAQLAPLWKAYGIQPQGKGFEHSARVLLIDRRGVQRVAWPTQELTPEDLAHDLRLLGAGA
jgi:protein SCO1/2